MAEDRCEWLEQPRPAGQDYAVYVPSCEGEPQQFRVGEGPHERDRCANCGLQIEAVPWVEDATPSPFVTNEHAPDLNAMLAARRCETCRDSVTSTSGTMFCIGPGHGVAREEFGFTCGSWQGREGV